MAAYNSIDIQAYEGKKWVVDSNGALGIQADNNSVGFYAAPTYNGAPVSAGTYMQWRVTKLDGTTVDSTLSSSFDSGSAAGSYYIKNIDRTRYANGDYKMKCSLNSNFSAPVGETTFHAIGTQTADAVITVYDFASSVAQNEYVVIAGAIQNVGSAAGTFRLKVNIDGQLALTKSIGSVAVGASLPWSFNQLVNFTIGSHGFVFIIERQVGTSWVEDERTGAYHIAVISPTQSAPRGEITSISGVPATVAAGTAINAIVTFRNVGDALGSFRLLVTANGATTTSNPISVSAGIQSQIQTSLTLTPVATTKVKFELQSQKFGSYSTDWTSEKSIIVTGTGVPGGGTGGGLGLGNIDPLILGMIAVGVLGVGAVAYLLTSNSGSGAQQIRAR